MHTVPLDRWEHFCETIYEKIPKLKGVASPCDIMDALKPFCIGSTDTELEFTDEGWQKALHRIHEVLMDRNFWNLCKKGLYHCGVNSDGQIVYWKNPAAKLPEVTKAPQKSVPGLDGLKRLKKPWQHLFDDIVSSMIYIVKHCCENFTEHNGRDEGDYVVCKTIICATTIESQAIAKINELNAAVTTKNEHYEFQSVEEF